MTELKEQLNRELHENVELYNMGELTYEELHAVQKPIIDKIKTL